MKITLIQSKEEFERLDESWNSLLESNGNGPVYLTHEWITAWWNNFGEGHEMHILLAHDRSGNLAAIAPFMRLKSRYRGLNIKKISLMANGHSPSSDFIFRRGVDEEAVTKSIIKKLFKLNNWDVLELTRIESSGKTYANILKSLWEEKRIFGLKTGIESPFILIDRGWDEFFENRSKKFKKSMRNKINRAKNEDITIEKHGIKSSLDRPVTEMVAVSSNSWKKEIGTDLGTSEKSRGFYLELCDRLGPKGLVSIWMMKKGGAPIAFEYHVTHGGVIYPIRADYDESYASLSPGSILEYTILKQLFETKAAREYHTCGTTYQYLLNWSEATRRYMNIEIFHKNYLSYSLYALEYKVVPMLRRLGASKVNAFLKDKGLL